MILNKGLRLLKCNKLKSLGNLKEVNGWIELDFSIELEDLGNLEYVNSNLYLIGCHNLKSLGNLKKVKGKIYLKGSGITKEYVEKNHLHLLNKCDWDYSPWF